MTIALISGCGCFFQGRDFHVDPGCLTHGGTVKCDACGKHEAPELLDAKPSDGDWEHGDYDRSECIACYGPGYVMLDPDHASLSIRPELAGLYEAWVEQHRLADIVWC